jgi:class 3 adenylate cyclase
MSELPSGTVTFAFTDIEGSTSLLKQLGDDYATVLSDHRRLVRDTFTTYDGVEIDRQGDAFFFAFVRARDAVTAAAEVQRAHVAHEWPGGSDVRMRIGLHTGEPTVGEEGYLGLDVVRAARLCGACEGGHVLLSEATRALVGTTLPPGVSVFPLGERHLKDMDEPERVYELEIEGVALAPSEAPASPPPSPAKPITPAPHEARRERRQNWEAGVEKRVQSLAERTVESVLGAIERGLGASVVTSSGAAAEGSPSDESSVEDIAAQAEELAKRIELKIKLAGRKRRDVEK